MSQKEQARLQVLNRVLERKMRVWEAAPVLGLSERQVWRILAAYRREGAAALAHGNRGKKPAHSIPQEVTLRVRELAQVDAATASWCHLAPLRGRRGSRSTPRP